MPYVQFFSRWQLFGAADCPLPRRPFLQEDRIMFPDGVSLDLSFRPRKSLATSLVGNIMVESLRPPKKEAPANSCDLRCGVTFPAILSNVPDIRLR
jgi:hypothetical protein